MGVRKRANEFEAGEGRRGGGASEEAEERRRKGNGDELAVGKLVARMCILFDPVGLWRWAGSKGETRGCDAVRSGEEEDEDRASQQAGSERWRLAKKSWLMSMLSISSSEATRRLAYIWRSR